MHRTQSLYTKLNVYPKYLALTLLILGIVFFGVVIIQQKLPNDQIELAQPDDSFTFQSDLSSLPKFGQTMVAGQAGLRGVYIPVSVIGDERSKAGLTLHLRSNPEATEDIRTTTLSLAELHGQNLARFTFAPLPDSFNVRYYFFIEPVPGEGRAEIELRYGEATSYLDGALYVDGEPQDFQANFFLAYDRRLMIADWINWVKSTSLTILLALLLFLLPGGALLKVLRVNYSLDWFGWLILSAGFSLALFPLLLLWGTLFGVKFGAGLIWGLLIVSAAVLSWSFLKGGRVSTRESRWLLHQINGDWLINLLLVLVVLFLFFSRFVPVRPLEVPMWQDSNHHTIIASLIVENHQLFNSWLPYVPLTSFTAHYGFHTAVAFLHWTTSLTILQAVIVMGQLLNILAVLALYPLMIYLGGGRWGGIAALLIAGFLIPTPMVYTNWGRYPQLTGQALLPLAMYTSLFVLENKQKQKAALGVAIIFIAGVALSYYRTVFSFGLFIFLFSIVQFYRVRKINKATLIVAYKPIVIMVGFLLIAILPWIVQVFEGKLPLFLALLVSQQVQAPAEQVQMRQNDWLLISQFLPLYIWGSALLIWLFGLVQRWLFVALFGIWSLILVLPSWLGLPASGMVVPSFGTMIFLYIPSSVLIGYAIGKITGFGGKIGPHISKVALTVITLVTVGWGGFYQMSLIDFSGRLVTEPDEVAVDWINENIPPSAKFLVNAKISGGGWVTGTDAGLWLPTLTGHETTVPPEYYVNETSADPSYAAQILNISRQVQAEAATNPEMLARFLREQQITHIYLGQRQGLTPYSLETLLKPEYFLTSSAYQLIYRQDRVWIFAITPS